MIREIIQKAALSLEPMPTTINGEASLWGLYHCEKYDQNNTEPRFEPAYAPEGYYYERSADVRDRWTFYGRVSACSYSNFQILFNTACELGYNGPPLALDKDDMAVEYVCRYIRRRIIEKGAIKPEHIADAYNSGTFKDDIIPSAYIRKFMRYYERALRKQCQ